MAYYRRAFGAWAEYEHATTYLRFGGYAEKHPEEVAEFIKLQMRMMGKPMGDFSFGPVTRPDSLGPRTESESETLRAIKGGYKWKIPDYSKGKLNPINIPIMYGLGQLFQISHPTIRKIAQMWAIGEMKGSVRTFLDFGGHIAEEQQKAGDTGAPTTLAGRIEDRYNIFYDFWKAGIGLEMGSTLAQAQDLIVSTGQLLYSYRTLMWNSSVIPRMKRHWMSKYTPTVPDTGMAWNLWKRGNITEEEFGKYASYDGWDAKGIERVKTTMQTLPRMSTAFGMMTRGDMTKTDFQKYLLAEGWEKEWHDKLEHLLQKWPYPQQAFYMWKKGDITLAKRNEFYKAGGIPEKLYDINTKNWEYVPTPYELMRLSDDVELDQIWATGALKRRGMGDRDVAQVIPALMSRPSRYQINNLTSKIVWAYRMGRLTEDQLSSDLDLLVDRGWIFRTEKNVLIARAYLDFQQELLDEQIEVYIWRFRTGRISEEQFLANLLGIGVREEKANLIVETQLAMGYFGYY